MDPTWDKPCTPNNHLLMNGNMVNHLFFIRQGNQVTRAVSGRFTPLFLCRLRPSSGPVFASSQLKGSLGIRGPTGSCVSLEDVFFKLGGSLRHIPWLVYVDMRHPHSYNSHVHGHLEEGSRFKSTPRMQVLRTYTITIVNTLPLGYGNLFHQQLPQNLAVQKLLQIYFIVRVGFHGI